MLGLTLLRRLLLGGVARRFNSQLDMHLVDGQAFLTAPTQKFMRLRTGRSRVPGASMSVWDKELRRFRPSLCAERSDRNAAARGAWEVSSSHSAAFSWLFACGDVGGGRNARSQSPA